MVIESLTLTYLIALDDKSKDITPPQVNFTHHIVFPLFNNLVLLWHGVRAG